MSITSDELNFLVYRYLQESGFSHSAFVFAYESLVGRADLATADIPPGALINFLQKGLQFVEIEKELEQHSAVGGSDLANGLALMAGARDASGAGKDAAAGSASGAAGKGAADSGAGGGPEANLAGTGAGKTTLDLYSKTKAGPTADSGWVTEADVTKLTGHEAEVLFCAWNPKANIVASGSSDSTVRIWTIPRGASGLPASTAASANPFVLHHELQQTLGALASTALHDVTTLDWRSDGQQLATGTYDGIARIWTVQGELKHTLRRHRGTIFSMRWNKSGTYLLSGSVDRTVVVWDAVQGKAIQEFDCHSSPILDVDWRDDTTFATCSTDMIIYCCKVNADQPIAKLVGHTNEVNAVKWSPDGTLLASCSDDCTAKVWKLGQDAFVHNFNEHEEQIYQIAWAPRGPGTADKSLLATASFDSLVKIWDVDTGKCIHTLDEHNDKVYSIAFSPDGHYLASGSLDATLRIWSLKDGKCIRKYKNDGGIYEVSWNMDGDKVAACYGAPSKMVCIIDFHK